jgi:cell division topological specificity factor
MNFLDRILRHSDDSAQVAKQRLQMVLIQDRTNISPETLNLLKDEIVTVISKYVAIDQANVQVTISESNLGHQLIANIPVIGKEPGRAYSAKRPAPRKAP